jgi:hypothetical protein
MHVHMNFQVYSSPIPQESSGIQFHSCGFQSHSCGFLQEWEGHCKVLLDDVKVEYHPRSGCPPQFFCFDEYKSNFQDLDSVDIPVDPGPWKPFCSCLDFELAELILDTHMNENQTNEPISLIHQCISDPKSFTLKNEPDLAKIWENAANQATAVGRIFILQVAK